MKKEVFNFSDLSKKELESLKDYYVQEKVNNMSDNQLRQFAIENINHQIQETIGDEEEKEAWEEMKSFFKDEFVVIIERIKENFKDYPRSIEENKVHNLTKLNSKLDDQKIDEKVDMWED